MKKILFLIFTSATFLMYSCDDRLEELNTDKKNPSEVDPSTLFASGLKNTFDNIESASVNNNPFRLYAQYWAQTTYPEESQYNLTSRSIPRNYWASIYRDVLADLNEAKRLIQIEIDEENFENISREVYTNRIATIDILMAYNYMLLVDAFGDVPFSEALDVDNLTPQYDDAATIYDNVLSMIDNAIAAYSGSNAFPASQDAMYNGSVSSWITFANSLKLRMGMRLVDVDYATASNVVTDAIAAGVFTSNADNASVQYMTAAPNTNPVYSAIVLSGRNDFVIANVFAEELNELEDPRLFEYASNPVLFGFPEDANDEPVDSTFVTDGLYLVYQNVDKQDSATVHVTGSVTVEAKYAGRLRVYKGGTYGSANSFGSNAKLSAKLYNDPTFPGVLLSYSEVEFLLAEAIERGITTGDAEIHYNAGIEASFDFWGANGYEDYIAQPQVAYTTAAGDYEQKIGKQLWISLYNQGVEAWATYRRLDFDALRPLPGDDEVSVPLRFPYPLEEEQLNGASVSAAAAAIGGDNVTTRVFWDVN